MRYNEHFEQKYDFWKSFVPLIQTLLWILIVLIILLVYNRQIVSIIEAIRKRIESGSRVKVGPVEIESVLLPQNPEEQKRNTFKNIKEVTETEQTVNSGVRIIDIVDDKLRQRYYLAEDLALRAIQAEYNVPIQRQLKAGRNMEFDGFFASGGIGYIIEVKYSRSNFNLTRVTKRISSLFEGIAHYNWKNITIVVAIVYEETVDLNEEKKRIEEITKDYKIPVEIRCFNITELSKRFGIS